MSLLVTSNSHHLSYISFKDMQKRKKEKYKLFLNFLKLQKRMINPTVVNHRYSFSMRGKGTAGKSVLLCDPGEVV